MNKEVPSFTKPHGKLGAERQESSYSRQERTREHINKNTGPGAGYRNVGKSAKNPTDFPSKGTPGSERTEGAYRRKDATRPHPHQGR